MLRLDLKDNKSTVLFIDPMSGVKICKVSGYGLHIKTGFDVCNVEYDSIKYRDTAYEYVMNKINECFDQTDSSKDKVGFHS